MCDQKSLDEYYTLDGCLEVGTVNVEEESVREPECNYCILVGYP